RPPNGSALTLIPTRARLQAYHAAAHDSIASVNEVFTMVQFLSSRRFLAAYSGLLTLLFLFTILSGFSQAPNKQAFDEITVHRINVVDPDGTIRLVITNTANSPGIYIKNKEHPHPSGRKGAGLLFFDEEGTEDGGLSYGIDKDKSGRVTGGNGHLSFDQYM